MRGSSESFPPYEVPPKESPKSGSFLERAKNSTVVKAGLVAVGLHGVALESPKIVEGVKDIYGLVSGRAEELFQRVWETPGMVAHVQTPEEQAAIRRENDQRRARADAAGLKAFKETARARMEKGEPLTYRELYFEQARLNGVLEADVAEAKQTADELVDHYVGRIEHDHQAFDESFIKQTSQELADRAQSVWGKGSVIDYFKKKDAKRNCVAFAQAERIVFEGIINHLPETERWRYQVGMRLEQQHDMAVLRIAEQRGGSSFATIVLQAPFSVERGEPPAGTATIDQSLLKRALVSEKPVTVQAMEPAHGEAVHEGPYIDVVSNQAVDEGIEVEGRLRAAEFNRQQILEEKLVIEPKQEDVIELELLDDDFRFKQEQRSEGGYAGTRVEVDVTSSQSLSVAQIDSIHADDSHALMDLVRFGSTQGWTEEAAMEALAQMDSATELSFQIDPQHALSEAFFRALRQSNHLNGKTNWEVIHFRDPDPSENVSNETRLPFGDLKQVVSILDGYNQSLRLDHQTLTPDEAELLAKADLKGVYLTRHFFSPPPPHVERSGVEPQDAYIDSVLRASKAPVYYQPFFAGAEQVGEDYLKDDDKLYPDLADLNESGLDRLLQESEEFHSKKAEIMKEFCRRFKLTRTDATYPGLLPAAVRHDWIRATSMPVEKAWSVFVQHARL